MTSLPSKHPSLGIHLSDRNLHPVVTSAQSDTQLEALTSLATTSLTAHAAAQRLALGSPQRLIVEHGPGQPVFLASYLDPAAAQTSTTDPNAARTTTAKVPSPVPPTEAFAATSLSSAAAGTATSAPPTRPSTSHAASSSSDVTLAATNGGPTPRKSRTRPQTRESSPSHHRKRSSRADSSATAKAATPSASSTSVPATRHHKQQQQPQATRKKTPQDDKKQPHPTAPMLMGLVVAGTAEEALDARRAAVRLERIGKDVQREWADDDEYDSDEDKANRRGR